MGLPLLVEVKLNCIVMDCFVKRMFFMGPPCLNKAFLMGPLVIGNAYLWSLLFLVKNVFRNKAQKKDTLQVGDFKDYLNFMCYDRAIFVYLGVICNERTFI